MMWDFRNNQGDRDRSHSRSPQPPPFPVPQSNGPVTYAYSAPAGGSSFPPPSPMRDPYISRDYLSVSPSNTHPGHPMSAPPHQGQFPASTQVIVIHHRSKSKHKHKSKELHTEERGRERERKEKKKSKSKSRSRDPPPHSRHHTLSHSYSTPHLNIHSNVSFPTQTNLINPSPTSPAFLTVPPRGHRHTFSQPQIPTQPLLPPPSPRLHHQHSTNVLVKPRPNHQIVQSHSAPLIPSTSHVPVHVPSHGPKPIHGILKPSAHQAPEPLNPHFQYSKCTGRKRALCIGINYNGQSNTLRGCVNDARHVRDFLLRTGGYRSEDIFLLTDEPPKGTREGRGWDSRNLPTRENIIRAMKWLVRGARKDDSLFFHYSGHGGQTRDKDGDEVDGWDEVIYPLDFVQAGHIIDDELHDIMVKPLPAGCRLTGLFDSCHSGTVLDLPYIYSSHGRLKGSHIKPPARQRKATSADVISWSGCKDDQTSSDTFAGGVAVGAMSYAFITSLTQNSNQTYQQLLRSVRHILHPRFSQRPQLGSSHHIDTNLRFIF